MVVIIIFFFFYNPKTTMSLLMSFSLRWNCILITYYNIKSGKKRIVSVLHAMRWSGIRFLMQNCRCVGLWFYASQKLEKILLSQSSAQNFNTSKRRWILVKKKKTRGQRCATSQNLKIASFRRSIWRWRFFFLFFCGSKCPRGNELNV